MGSCLRGWKRPAASAMLVLTIAACRPSADLGAVLARHGIGTGGNDLRALPATITPGALAGSQVVTAGTGERFVRVTFTSAPDVGSEVWAVQQRELLESIFSPHLPPYPEFLTRETGCPEEFLPTSRAVGLGTVQLLYAGANRGYGVCAPGLVRYRAAVVYGACRGRDEVFAIELFAPPTEPDVELVAVVSQLECR